MKILGGTIAILSFVVYYYAGVLADGALGASLTQSMEDLKSMSFQEMMSSVSEPAKPIGGTYKFAKILQHVAVGLGSAGALLFLFGWCLETDRRNVG